MFPESSDRNRFAGFEILADDSTSIGQLSLRRRRSQTLEQDIYEMLLDHDLVMSSAVTDSERALTSAALGMLPDRPLRLLIGGLGLGFTAMSALEDLRVAHVTVLELLEPVIRWHKEMLLPWSQRLMQDKRVEIRQGDFFADLNALEQGANLYDAILLDIDDTPNSTWSPSHQAFYSAQGLSSARNLIAPGGVFALWCADHPERSFLKLAREVFPDAQLTEIRFFNPSLHCEESNFLILASKEASDHA